MEISEIISYVLTVIVPGLAVWSNKIQHQISDLKTSVAVNTSKDEEMWVHVQKMEGKLDKLIDSVAEIREAIAGLKS